MKATIDSSSTLRVVCDRCKSRPTVFRVISETLNMKVCSPCAVQAWRLGLKVEALEKPEIRELVDVVSC